MTHHPILCIKNNNCFYRTLKSWRVNEPYSLAPLPPDALFFWVRQPRQMTEEMFLLLQGKFWREKNESAFFANQLILQHDSCSWQQLFSFPPVWRRNWEKSTEVSDECPRPNTDCCDINVAGRYKISFSVGYIVSILRNTSDMFMVENVVVKQR